MKIFKLSFLVLIGSFACMSAVSQNVLMNILTHNTGIVNKGESVFLEVTVCNTDATDSVAIYKLKPQISVPTTLLIIPDTGHILPAGWTITFNNGSVIRLSNGTDIISASDCRTILIAMKGNAIGGPETIGGILLFSNGAAPGSASGMPTQNDNPSDNSSTSTCKVLK